MNKKSSSKIIFYIVLVIVAVSCGNQQPEVNLDATVEARVKATVTVIGIDEPTQVESKLTPTLIPQSVTPSKIPPTFTPTIIPPKITTAPLSTCLLDLPPGSMVFSHFGKFEPPQPPTLDESLDRAAWNSARRIICDDTFLFQDPQGDYNIWSGVLISEENSAPDAIPHIIAEEGDKKTGTIIKEYGEPSSISQFRMDSGEILDVYWFGPIFIIADRIDGRIREIGGWLPLLFE